MFGTSHAGAPSMDQATEVMMSTWLLLLLLIAVASVMASKLSLPAPALLVVAGMTASLVPGFPHVLFSPDLVLVILLPPLLYTSAWQTNWRDFKRNLVPISFLAIGLVGFTVLAVASLAWRMSGFFDWRAGFLLGAVAATTDAIAVASLGKIVRLPARVLTILDGESLVNDATGLLALELGLRLLNQGDHIGWTEGLLHLLWLIFGGTSAGLAVGIVLARLERSLDDEHVEMAISLITPYAAYLLGTRIHGSGVLAVVSCGIFCSRRSTLFFSPSTRLHVREGWSALEFLLNAFVSVLVGLQTPLIWSAISGFRLSTLIAYGLLLSALLLLLRLCWIFTAAPPARWVAIHLFGQEMAPFNKRGLFLASWTGMRGIVALAAAFSLPAKLASGQPFKQRGPIIFLTFVVILVTLVLQGSTLAAVVRWLKLDQSEDTGEELLARRAMLVSAITFLEAQALSTETPSNSPTTPAALRSRNLLESYRAQLAVMETAEAGMAQSPLCGALAHEQEAADTVVSVQRQVLLAMRDKGSIGDDVMHRLERELDLMVLQATAPLAQRAW